MKDNTPIPVAEVPEEDVLAPVLFHVMQQFPSKAGYVKALDNAVINYFRQQPDFDEHMPMLIHPGGGGSELQFRLREVRKDLKDLGVLCNPLQNFWSISPAYYDAKYLDMDELQVKWEQQSQETSVETPAETPNPERPPLQKIFFGAPGTGKSYRVNAMLPDRGDDRTKAEENLEEEKKEHRHVFRTTFHPGYKYDDFVGSFKQVEIEEKDQFDHIHRRLTFKFIPQVFTIAYVTAWTNYLDLSISEEKRRVWLVIEEINRGNCALIFGDIFQLLDRSNGKEGSQMPYGFSEYLIQANTDLAEWLNKNEEYQKVVEQYELLQSGRLCLPPNLSIIATMNTTDQSLFPVDMAFKRRWEWEYIPINYHDKHAAGLTITIGDMQYSWVEFLEKINSKIRGMTSSEDKQLGTFFIRESVSEQDFISKVIFFLWSDICKEEYHKNPNNFLRWERGFNDAPEFTFNELFTPASSVHPGATLILQHFMKYIGVKSLS